MKRREDQPTKLPESYSKYTPEEMIVYYQGEIKELATSLGVEADLSNVDLTRPDVTRVLHDALRELYSLRTARYLAERQIKYLLEGIEKKSPTSPDFQI